jgi:hypothetical protein
MRRLAVPLAVLALGAAAPAADAVTPQQARAVAEQAIAAGPDAGPFQHHGALIPAQRRRFRPVVEIHTLRRVLRAGTLVGQGLEGRRKMYRVKAPAVLAWGDYAPGAGFAHPSRLVVVDRRTNRVVHNRVIGWWPEGGCARRTTRRDVAAAAAPSCRASRTTAWSRYATAQTRTS